MPWSLTPERRDDPELMDAPGLPEVEVEDAYRVLRRVNRWFFGALPSMARELRQWLAEDRPTAETPTILDVGTGSGDVPRFIADRLASLGRPARALALDRDGTALLMARRLDLDSVRGDALRLPLADRSIDLVTAVKFAHHFHGPRLEALIAEMARVARHRVIVLDIRRDWRAYWGFVAWSRVFTRNRLVQYDGPLSVLRGFTRGELSGIAAPIPGYSWTVRPHAGFQLALVGKRDQA